MTENGEVGSTETTEGAKNEVFSLSNKLSVRLKGTTMGPVQVTWLVGSSVTLDTKKLQV